MLVVRGTKATDLPPLVYGLQGLAPPDHKAPKGPLSPVVVEGEGYGGGPGLLGKYRGGVHHHQDAAPGGGGW